jgi:hypothetical protein
MRILCRHGHFALYPESAEEISKFQSWTNTKLFRSDDFYTFERLYDLPNYSLTGAPFGNILALKTFEGKPWEVMKENGYVYNVTTKLIVPKLAIVDMVSLNFGQYYYSVQNGILQPGTRQPLPPKQILSYDAYFDCDKFQLKIFGVEYE